MGLPFLTFLGLGAILTLGTVYSVVYQTYLDTSNPLLSLAPHPLADTHYFASKKSLLNTIFIKYAWGWTSGAFLFLFVIACTIPVDPFPPLVEGEVVEEKEEKQGRFVYRAAANPETKCEVLRWETSYDGFQRFGLTIRPFMRWIVLTAFWALFTAWFFGPALFTRIALATGGECVLVLPFVPPGDADFEITPIMTQPVVLQAPADLCHSRTPLSPDTHPTLFTDVLADPRFALSGKLDLDGLVLRGYLGPPRIRRGHDVSGHVFLITVAALFLAELIQNALTRLNSINKRSPRVSWNRLPDGFYNSLLTRAIEAQRKAAAAYRLKTRSTEEKEPRGWNRVERRVIAYKVATGLASVLLGIWIFAMYTTGVYFHTPLEKMTGFVLGASTYSLSLYLVANRGIPRPIPMEPGPNIVTTSFKKTD